MRDLSLHLLDLTQNSVTAGASLVEIQLTLEENGWLTMVLRDDGKGMSPELLARVTSPFATTRTTRKVGLGVPFFKQAALGTGGSFHIQSEVGRGTEVTAVFRLDSIDRMPMGDLCGTLHTLITFHPDTDFLCEYRVDDRGFTLDTRQFREILGGVPLDEPEVSQYIKEYLEENLRETNGDVLI